MTRSRHWRLTTTTSALNCEPPATAEMVSRPATVPLAIGIDIGAEVAGSVGYYVAGVVVMKPKLPSSNRRPWNDVVCEIRSMASNDESICNWLAAICSSLKAPVLAAFMKPGREYRSKAS